MKNSPLAALLVLVLLAASPAMAQGPAKKLTYDSFRMMRTRNIFDPDRKANMPSQPARATASAPVTAADYVALTGILLADDKALAFFSGSRQEYNKVLPLNGSIVGATILKINPAAIELDRAGRHITVAVGQTVPTDGSAPAAAPTSASTSFSSTSASSAPAGISPDKEAVLRRMMERRQKELK